MSDDPGRALIEQRLEEMFARVSHLHDDDLVLLRSTWNEGDAKQRESAWRRAKAQVERRGRADLLDEAKARMATWAHGQSSGFALEYGNLMASSGSILAVHDVRRDALPPLLDAVAAIVAADGLSAEEQAELLEPLNALLSALPPA